MKRLPKDKRRLLVLPRISRFEGRIMMSIVLCATIPFLISLIFIPSIIESRLAMSMHAQVDEQLEASALFYREFFDAKKSEYAARALAIARDPALIRAVHHGSTPKIVNYLDKILSKQEELRTLRVVKPDSTLWVERNGPKSRQSSLYRPRVLKLPIGLPQVAELEATFILSGQYLEDQDRAADIALVYQTTRRLESDRARSFYLAYFGILVAAVGLSLWVGLSLSRGVTKRVSRLAAATERVAGGDLSFQVPVGGRDEIARLTRGFNRMISEVAEARDRIVYLEKVSGWQDLARRLAHEIKNPLTPIRLAVQELRTRARNEDPSFEKLMHDVTEVVDEEVEALTRLVDEFSQFARLPAVIPTRVDLQRFLQSFLRAYLKYREDAEIELVLPEHSFDAPIDEVLLRRVLVNLVDNAIDATQTRPVQIRLRANFEKESGRSYICVEDAGAGVPPDLVNRIFEPYFTTKDTGTGLGLAIVKKIVLQHGGTISLERSELGGASFIISLPPTPPHLTTVAAENEDDQPLPIPSRRAQQH